MLPSTLPPVAADVDVVVDEDTDDEVDEDELAPSPTPPQLENKTALIATATEITNFFIFSFFILLKTILCHYFEYIATNKWQQPYYLTSVFRQGLMS